MTPRFILASASPARRALLLGAGIDAEVIVSGVDESTVDISEPAALTATLARLKAEAVSALPEASLATASASLAPALVLGCDSMLAFDGGVFGKPVHQADAAARWRRMRGRSGVLHTGHHLIDTASGRHVEAGAATIVHFADVTDAEIDAYLATGEPLHVAGGFTIDGLGGPFVERIEGDHGNVIGLSLPLLRRMLRDLGHDITALWAAANV